MEALLHNPASVHLGNCSSDSWALRAQRPGSDEEVDLFLLYTGGGPFRVRLEHPVTATIVSATVARPGLDGIHSTARRAQGEALVSSGDARVHE